MFSLCCSNRNKYQSQISSNGQKPILINSDGKKSTIDNQPQIAVVGDSEVGKSSIIEYAVKGQINSKYSQTLGMDLHFLQISTKNHQYNFKVYDTAGKQQILHITLNIINQSQGVAVVFSLDNKQSFESLSDWVKKIRDVNQEVPIVVLGNKSDLKQQAVSQNEINQLIDKLQLKYYQTSAADGKNIVNSFEYIVRKAKKLKQKEQTQLLSNNYDQLLTENSKQSPNYNSHIITQAKSNPNQNINIKQMKSPNKNENQNQDHQTNLDQQSSEKISERSLKSN